MVYDWIFCYKNRKFHIEHVRNPKFPYKLTCECVTIDKREFEKWILKFSLYLTQIIDFSRVQEALLDASGGCPGYTSFWYVLVKLFEVKFGFFPIVNDLIEEALKNIYEDSRFTLIEKLVYGFAYLFALYRIHLLEKKLRVRVVVAQC